jgi:ABC-2 type transport system permease protein
MRLLISTLGKLRSRLATWLTLGLLILLMALIYLAVGATAKDTVTRPNGQAVLLLITFPGAYALILGFVLGLGGLFVMAYAAAIAGSEWQWGTLKTAVARGESRSRYMLTTYTGIALLAGVGMLVAFAVGVVVTFLSAKLAGVSTDGITDTSIFGNLPEQFLRGWFGLIELGAVGFTIATLARSQLAGVGAGIGIYFAGSFAGLFLPDVVKYLPFAAANSLIAGDSAAGGAGGGQTLARLDPNAALVVVLIWLVGSLLVTALFTERAEISG